ncbi:hypothetical protein D3C71_1461170 [compost metagenome]
MASGTFRRGFSLSPAATPISSVPWKEKPAAMKTPTKAKKPPWKELPPSMKLSKPVGLPPRMPKIISKPAARKTITVMILIMANQYSDSPYPRDDRALSPNISIRKSRLHSMEELSGNQYLMMTVAADSSAAIVTAQLYQKFQPIAKPNAGLTKRVP